MNFSPIAVVGMSCVFPAAPDTDTFWRNIINKKDATVPVPQDRWVAAKDRVISPVHAPDKAVSNRAGLITDFQLDPSGLDLDPELLNALDPMHHLVLETGRNAFNQVNLGGAETPESFIASGNLKLDHFRSVLKRYGKQGGLLRTQLYTPATLPVSETRDPGP